MFIARHGVRRVAAALTFFGAMTGPVAMRAHAARQGAADIVKIPFETYTLSNGLSVILSVDHSAPTVAVDVWYHVGSKNEQVGRTGLAHLFEHMMGTGSAHASSELRGKLTWGVGGVAHATTDNDRTTYYAVVPSNYLEDEIWLDSDQMGFLLDTLDLTKVNTQRDVVKNERRQREDNQPYGRADEILREATYPAGHPYSWEVSGSMEDLSAASLDDVKNFFRLYYAPNNAILSIAGDFDIPQTKAWVTKYFGDLPHGQAVTRPTAQPVTLSTETRLVFEDHVPVPHLYLQWPTVGAKNEDIFALDVLSSVLAGARTTRLTNALVYETQKAADVEAFQNPEEDAGEFGVTITPRPNTSLSELEAATDAIIDKLKADGPTADEIERATAAIELDLLSGLQSDLGKASQLARGLSFYGNPGYFQTRYAKYQAITAADVKRVANQYLTTGRVVLSVVPTGKLDLASKPGESKRVAGNGLSQRGGR